MRVGFVLVVALILVGPVSAQDQFKVEYKLYRSMVPDDASGELGPKKMVFGLMKGPLDGEIAKGQGFRKIGKYMVWHQHESDEGKRYELVTQPQLVTLADQESTIQIGEEIPYRVSEPGEDGQSEGQTRHKTIGTTINVKITKPTEGGANIDSNGEFVTLVSRGKPIETKDLVGQPNFQTTTWENKSTVPYGAWSFQRVEVGNGHEFLSFARVTRFSPEATNEDVAAAQYSVETKLITVPTEHAEIVRKRFVYDENQNPTGDDARVFRVYDSSAAEGDLPLISIPTYFAELKQYDVELISAPRMTLGSGPRKKIVASPKAAEVGPSNMANEFLKHSPLFADFFGTEADYLGVIADLTHYRDEEDGPIVGFDGFHLGVQIDPPSSFNAGLLGLDLFFHNQYKTGGREQSLLRKAVPYTFGNQAFRFPDLSVLDGGWIGIEFTSKKTNDLTLLLVDVDSIDPSAGRFFEADVKNDGTSVDSTPVKTPGAKAFSDVAIPEDIELVMNILPRIDGEGIRLWLWATTTEALATDPEHAPIWTNVIVHELDRVVLGITPDDVEGNHLKLLGIRPTDEAQLSSDNPEHKAEDSVDNAAFPDERDGVNLSPYSVETRVVRIPKENVEAARALFTYVEDLVPTAGSARAFHAITPENDTFGPSLMWLEHFNYQLEQLDVSLETAPRVILSNRVIDAKWDVNRGETHDMLLAASRRTEKYMNSQKPYTGLIADFLSPSIPTSETDPTPRRGFDGHIIGVQIEPPEEKDGSILSMDILFHNQFVKSTPSGKEGRKKEYVRSFENDLFEFANVRMRVGSWIGFEFESKKSGDLIVVTVNVTNVDPMI
jgi:hypothetical protein